MIQLSSLLASNAETPVKAAVAAAPAGAFASLLEGELGLDEAASGKILPEGGKTLPDALPVEGEAAQAPRVLIARIAAAKAKSPVGETVEKGAEEVKAQPQAEPETAAVDVAETQAEAPTDAPAEAKAAAVAIELPQATLPAIVSLVPGQVQPQTEQSEDDTAELQRNEKSAAQGAQPQAVAVAKLAVARQATRSDNDDAQPQTNDTEAVQSTGAEKSADKANSARSVRPSQEFRFELARDPKPANAGELASARSGQPASAPALPMAPAVQAQLPDSVNASGATKAVADTADAQQGLRPHEFTTLVDRLVEARESARGGAVNVSVMHADFGEVSLRFNHDNGNLTVSMSNQDPDFARAVNAATPADSSQTGDMSSQGGRRDDNAQNASARAGTDARASTGEGGSNRHGTGSGNDNQQAERAEPQHRAAGQGGAAMGGVYA